MKKLYASALLSLALLAPGARAGTFGLFTWGCFCHSKCTIKLKPYNAFSSACSGDMYVKGCLPFMGCPMPCMPYPMPPQMPCGPAPCLPDCCDAGPGGMSAPGETVATNQQAPAAPTAPAPNYVAAYPGTWGMQAPQAPVQQVGHYPYYGYYPYSSFNPAAYGQMGMNPAAYGQMGMNPYAYGQMGMNPYAYPMQAGMYGR